MKDNRVFFIIELLFFNSPILIHLFYPNEKSVELWEKRENRRRRGEKEKEREREEQCVRTLWKLCLFWSRFALRLAAKLRFQNETMTDKTNQVPSALSELFPRELFFVNGPRMKAVRPRSFSLPQNSSIDSNAINVNYKSNNFHVALISRWRAKG